MLALPVPPPSRLPELLDAALERDGLVPAIAQDAASGRVLTLAWMNREALRAHGRRRARRTTGRARAASCGARASRRATCRRCARSASTATTTRSCCVVEQVGGIACHTGRERCFFQRLEDGRWRESSPVLKDPKAIYGNG